MLKIVLFAILIIVTSAGYLGFQKYRGKAAIEPITTSGVAKPDVTTHTERIEDLSKVKLATFLGIDTGQIEIVKVKKVDWPDAALGAPEEGMMYAQVITPGYKVTMIAGSTLYEVHADAKGTQIVLVKDGKRLAG